MILRNIADNFITLLVAFVMATVIWVIAVQIDDPVETRSYILPMMTRNLPAGRLILENSVESVQITVEGPASVMADVTSTDFVAFTDLSNIVADIGNYDIQIQIANENLNPDDLDIGLPIPTQAEISVDRQITRDIAVQLIVIGSAGAGYEIGQGATDPATIQITGPSQRVNAIAEARVTALLDNARETFNASRRPIFYDQSGSVASVSGLTPSTDQVQVIVPVEQLAGVRSIPIVVSWTGLPASGYRLTNITVSPEFIEVRGTPAQVNNLDNIQTQTIDITEFSESFTQQVSLDLPEGIQLVEVSPFVVSADIEPILSTEIIRTQPVIRGLGEPFTATVDIETVRVTLFGPLPIVDSLTEEDVRVTLDLFGLEAGSHDVAPAVDVFAEDIEVRSIQPPLVTVFITNVLTTTMPMTNTLPITSTGTTTESLRLPAGAGLLADGYAPPPDLVIIQPPPLALPLERSWLI